MNLSSFPRSLALLLCLTLLGVATNPRPASAQINTERLRLTALDPGWSGSFDTSLALEEGNSDTLSATAGLRVNWALDQRCQSTASVAESDADGSIDDQASDEACAPDQQYQPGAAFFIGSYTFAEENDQRSKNRGFTHLRWTAMKTPVWGWEAFVQYQFNEFLRLDRRNLVGAGLRFAVDHSEHRKIFLGTTLMLERERIDLPALSPRDREVETVRWSNYVTVVGQWPRGTDNPRLRFSNTLYVQPSLEDLNDLRLLDDFELRVPLTEAIALSLSLSVLYDGEPPPGVETTDIILRNGISVSW